MISDFILLIHYFLLPFLIFIHRFHIFTIIIINFHFIHSSSTPCTTHGMIAHFTALFFLSRVQAKRPLTRKMP